MKIVYEHSVFFPPGEMYKRAYKRPIENIYEIVKALTLGLGISTYDTNYGKEDGDHTLLLNALEARHNMGSLDYNTRSVPVPPYLNYHLSAVYDTTHKDLYLRGHKRFNHLFNEERPSWFKIPNVEFMDAGASNMLIKPDANANMSNSGHFDSVYYDRGTDADAYYINDGGNDKYDGANEILLNGVRQYYDAATLTEDYVFAINFRPGTTEVKITGNLGADGSGSVVNDKNVKVDTAEGHTVYCSYRVTSGTNDSSIYHLLVTNKEISDHNSSDGTELDDDTYTLDGTTTGVLFVFWGHDEATAWDGFNVNDVIGWLTTGEIA